MNQKTCTFLGHRDCPESIIPNLKKQIKSLISNQMVTHFYVGNQGQFDAFVRRALQEIQKEYPHIHYDVVLAYLPQQKEIYQEHSDTILPEGIENVPPRYAIVWRNRWMLNHSHFVISYVQHSPSKAADFVREARKQGKNIFNLGSYNF